MARVRLDGRVERRSDRIRVLLGKDGQANDQFLDLHIEYDERLGKNVLVLQGGGDATGGLVDIKPLVGNAIEVGVEVPRDRTGEGN